VNFWATWCGECITEMPELVTMSRMYRHRGFELVLVSADHADKKDEALAFLKKQEASNKNLLFAGNQYAMIELVDKDWDGNLPYTVLIDKAGKALYRKAGRIDPLEVRREIVKALGQR
jgi:thiol-disulfide isomerase/thioredoxin